MRALSVMLLILAAQANGFQQRTQKNALPSHGARDKTTLVTDSSVFADFAPPISPSSSSIRSSAGAAVLEPSNFYQFPTIELPTIQARPKIVTELLGEAFGTFWIVGVGSMASMTASFVNPFMTLPQVAAVWAGAVTSAILMTSPLSGAHLNPSFTLANALFRNFQWNKVLPYIGAQVFGCAAGSAMAFGFFRNTIQGFEASQGLLRANSIATASVFGEYFDSSLTVAQALGVETLGTFLLASLVFGVTHKKNSHRDIPVSFVVGGAVYCLINLLAPFTQCGMNPARDFGPRIIAYLAGWTDVAFQNCWLYIAGPLIGAVSGAFLIDKILLSEKNYAAPIVDKAWL